MLYDQLQLFKDIEAMRSLKEGWDGYRAPPPSGKAIRRAIYRLNSSCDISLPPHRVAPDVNGGIGFTWRVAPRRIYLHILNDEDEMFGSQEIALFSDGASDPCIRHVGNDFALNIRSFLATGTIIDAGSL